MHIYFTLLQQMIHFVVLWMWNSVTITVKKSIVNSFCASYKQSSVNVTNQFLMRHFVCCAGIIDYLTTEISTSKQKKFSLVTFVDTPGLVDGDMKYPFDVNRAILWLGKAS